MRLSPSASTPDAADSAVPAGHRGPRAAVLLHLKEEGTASAKELAALLGCSLNAVRHHLKELEAEGVVGHNSAPRGVGAPVHSYRLTRQGHALFPDRYEHTVAVLLDHLVASEGREAAIALLQSHYRALAQRIEAEGDRISAERRGELVARLLAAEGYMPTWVASPGGGTLTEHNCPHQMIAERFPEICAAEEAFLAAALGGAVERRSQITAGCGTCTYHVALPTAKDQAAS